MSEFVFKLPDVGEGTAEAEIVAWHVAVGDHVEEDAALVDVMTDKATVEMTAPVSGVVISLHGEPGEMAAVGSPLAVIAIEAERKEGPDLARPAAKPPVMARDTVPAAPNLESKAQSPTVIERPSSPTPTSLPSDAPPLASPAVRRRAYELGIALQFIRGSGPAGRILASDLDGFVQSRETPAVATMARREGVESIKVIGLRRRIAERMQESKRRIPHFGYVEEVDVTELEALRSYLNAGAADRDKPRLTLLPFLITSVTRALAGFPQINATFDDDEGVIHRHRPVHVGIATQTANGLVVPVVRHAEARDVFDLATEIARLAAATREGKIGGDELKGSTITITSLGALGGVATTPVINYPEVAIIGPNKIVERPAVVSGQVVVRKMMNLSSSFDHRVVDGFDAAQFIQSVKGMLEHPASMFMDGL